MTVTVLPSPEPAPSSTRGQRNIFGSGWTRWFTLGLLIGPVGSTASFVILGARRSGYSPNRQQISVLGTGHDGIFMNVTFVLYGLLTLAGVQGLRGLLDRVSTAIRTAIMILLSFPPLGIIVFGFFHLDTNLVMHTIGAQVFAGTPVLIFPSIAVLLWRDQRRLGVMLIALGLIILAALLGYMFLSPTSPADFKSIVGGGTVGLWERILVEIVAFSYAALGILALISREHPQVRGSS